MHLVHNSFAPGEPVDPADTRHRCEWVSRARSAVASRIDFFRESPETGFELQVYCFKKEQES
jgi:hypothetical protein